MFSNLSLAISPLWCVFVPYTYPQKKKFLRLIFLGCIIYAKLLQ